MPSPIFISRPPAGFTFLSVFRGAQLTVIGVYRALQNPDLARQGYYSKAIKALYVSVIIQVVLWLPLIALRIFLSILLRIVGSGAGEGITDTIDTLRFLQNHVFNVGPLLISAMRYIRPDMDDLFLTSLQFMDKVYIHKHPESDRRYYKSLVLYGKQHRHLNVSMPFFRSKKGPIERLVDALPSSRPVTPVSASPLRPSTPQQSSPSGFSSAIKSGETTPGQTLGLQESLDNDVDPNVQQIATRTSFVDFLTSYTFRTGTTLLCLMGSRIPIIGRLVLPMTSFYSFNNVVGTSAALVVFAVGFVAPERWVIMFLSAFWGGRSLVRELLAPYFSRLPFSKTAKARWFSNREGIMFGFGAGFYLMMRVPFVGVLVYGLAQISAAYLITKVSDPPPVSPGKVMAWTEGQVMWTVNDKALVESFSSDGFSTAVPGSWNAEKEGK